MTDAIDKTHKDTEKTWNWGLGPVTETLQHPGSSCLLHEIEQGIRIIIVHD